MNLTPEQFEKLAEALALAYPSSADLKRLVRKLDWKLGRYTDLEKGIDDIIDDIIERAEARGKIKSLISAAYEGNPGNPALKAFVTKYPDLLQSGSHLIPSKSSTSFSLSNALSKRIALYAAIFLIIVLLPTTLLFWPETCNPERFEPNNKRADNCKIEPGQVIRAYPDDVEDIYYFELDEKSSVVITLLDYSTFLTTKEEDGQLLVYDEASPFESIAAIRYLHDQDIDILPNENSPKGTLRDLEPGRYYIRIHTPEGTFNIDQPYYLSITIIPTE